MNIQEKLNEIIPPDDYCHRNDFSNHKLIGSLNVGEKEVIADALIDKLWITQGDILIIETLAYLGSKKALPALENSLIKCNNTLQKVIIASYIFKIDRDYRMVDIALNAFNLIKEELDLALLFSYLATFNDAKTNYLIEGYFNHPNFIVAYNAKRALGLIQD